MSTGLNRVWVGPCLTATRAARAAALAVLAAKNARRTAHDVVRARKDATRAGINAVESLVRNALDYILSTLERIRRDVDQQVQARARDVTDRMDTRAGDVVHLSKKTVLAGIRATTSTTALVATRVIVVVALCHF